MVKIIHHPILSTSMNIEETTVPGIAHEEEQVQVQEEEQQQEQEQEEKTSTTSTVHDNLSFTYSPIPPGQLSVDANEVYDVMVDKLLANLGVIADLKEGDKLWYTSDGTLIIQNPGWLSTGMRTVFRINRWNQQDHLYTIIKNALKLIHTRFGDTIREALKRVLNGLNNLKMTYQGDSPIVNRISVLSNHIRKHVNFVDTETFDAIA